MKKTGIILVVLALCLAVSACAETMAASSILGTVTGDTYENALLGFSCTLEGWHYYTEEEIAQANQLAKEQLGEDLQKLLESTQAASIMGAETEDGLKNVNVQAQNISSMKEIYASLGLQYIAEASLDQYKQMLGASGLTDVDLSIGEISISGQPQVCIMGSYNLNGYLMYFRQVWLLSGDYLGNITVTSLADDAEEVFANFSLIQ